ncbi:MULTISPECIES: ribonuclease P protein component [unclassified Psychrobacter]|uniref:ribonuclease P protein component n=1 Tax=unclassified Psychrobacter TaxID=196806 RepID=UPI0018F4F560|nr:MULTISPECIES: ribonuclease P protein component [unclassified Psychrobacter]
MEKTSLISSDNRFLKSQRLLTPKAFKTVFDAPERKLHQTHLMAFVRDNEAEHARLGMAITKRKVPTAVMRNTLKRHIRESFRKKNSLLKNKDIVFIVKKPIDSLSKKEINLEINNILKKIKI